MSLMLTWYFRKYIAPSMKYYCKNYFNMNLIQPRVLTTDFVSSVQSLSRVRLFATPWTAARQASLSITNSWNSPKLSVMPSSHLILCHPLLLLPPIPPNIRVFSSESTLRMRWPKYWSFSLSISPSKEHPRLISFRMDWLDLPCSPRDSQESSQTSQFKSINSSVLSIQCELWNKINDVIYQCLQ